jgi:beta-lactamase superfamily II metal-dependent hydrolase
MSTRTAAKRTTRKATPPAAKTKTPVRPRKALGGASAQPAAPASAGSATGLKVRMYRVGFGDFFLVTAPTSAGKRYILIDCGVFKGTTGKGDLSSIEDAVEDLYTTTGGQLALVIMTHRHADHIAGFSRAARFNDFKVSMVWMPYWEQFNDAQGSPHNLQLAINELSLQLAMQFRGRTDADAQQAFLQLSLATGIDFDAAPTAGKKLAGNAAALDILKNKFGDQDKNVRYYAAGDAPELPAELEGLSAKILGPPPKTAQAFVQLTDFKKGVGQYLDSTTASDEGVRAISPFKHQWSDEGPDLYPQQDGGGFPIDYAGIAKAVGDAQPDMLAAAAAKIDTFLNNQSLVVLFALGDKHLLFVGDAQAGNWENWLYKLDAPLNDPTKAGAITDESQQILRTIDFYKVGHHGSTNATPIPVVDALGKDHSANGFVAMCSTQPGVYGNVDKGTEVPRDPLMKAIGDECALVRSDSIDITLSNHSVVPRAEGGTGAPPTPKAGSLSTADLYVEYSF